MKQKIQIIIHSVLYLILITTIVLLSINLGVAIKKLNSQNTNSEQTELSYYEKKVKVYDLENENFAKGQIVFWEIL